MATSFVVQEANFAVPGSFTVREPQSGAIPVAQSIIDAARQLGVTEPEEFASLSISFPDQVALVLGWSESEVLRAGRLLAELLGLPSGRGDSVGFGASLPQSLRGATPDQFANMKKTLG